jgi:polyisoprenoid-binding protein YceI
MKQTTIHHSLLTGRTNMKTRTLLTLTAAVFAIALVSGQASAQRVSFNIQPGSELSLNGTSTLHSYECSAESLAGTIVCDTATLAKTSTDSTVLNANVKIPVKGLHNSSDGLTKNMAEALKGDDYPVISFVLTQCSAAPDSAGKPGVRNIDAKGNLTIAGKTLPIEIPVSLSRADSGAYRLQGTRDLLMTDYGVDPPSFMFGVMKTNPKVVITFNLKLKAQ